MRRRWIATALITVLVLAACGGDDGDDEAGGSTTTPSSASDEVAAGPEGDAFYQPPDPLPEREPGDIIWSQPIDAPAGVVGWRVLYLSTSVADDAIAVSGVVYAPEGDLGARDRPVLAYAHGTTGMGDQCAPSRQDQPEPQVIAGLLVSRGFVVAATDYEGLGTPGVHPYVVGLSEARGVLDAVRAAQRLPEAGAGGRVVVAGHSQGGGAALVTGEVAADYAPELDLLGVVAGAPASELRLISGALQTSPFFGYVAMAAAGFHAAYPELELDEVLTPEAIAELDDIAGMCTDEIIIRYRGRDPASVVVADPGAVEPWASLLEENSPGVRPAGAPVLLFHGTADEQIPVTASQLVLDRYCQVGGAAVERRVYEGATHGNVVGVALPDIVAFIEARVAGQPAASSCSAG
ncbi:MAG: lipase family protein [Acidimicrobiales bacterium]